MLVGVRNRVPGGNCSLHSLNQQALGLIEILPQLIMWNTIKEGTQCQCIDQHIQTLTHPTHIHTNGKEVAPGVVAYTFNPSSWRQRLVDLL